jgi:hypothetical protein
MPINSDAHVLAMAKKLSCACGWTLISPQGENDLKKHTMEHFADAHPGMRVGEAEFKAMVKTV